MINLNYECSAYNPEKIGDFEPIPEGIYVVCIDEIQEKQSQQGNKYLALRLCVMEGDFIKRKIYENLNLYHPNDQVRAISNRTLDAIGYALGLSKISHTSLLLNRNFKIETKLDKNKKTRVYRYFRLVDEAKVKPTIQKSDDKNSKNNSVPPEEYDDVPF